MYDGLALPGPYPGQALDVLITVLTVLLAILGLAAVVPGWLTYRANRNGRELLYSTSPATSLLGTALRPAHPSLQFLYDGQPLAGPRDLGATQSQGA